MSSVVIHDCEQGSPEWYAARLGMPTASEFKTVLRDGVESKTRRLYLLKLAGERLTGEPMESYSNAQMERGKVMEAEARDKYAFLTDTELQKVGFVVNGIKGCSPDALIGKNGVLEIKSAAAHVLIEYHLQDRFPPEHMAQCQGNLWVTEREWLDLAIYWPKMPLFVRRVFRDETYIRDLSSAVAVFDREVAQTVEKIRKLQ